MRKEREDVYGGPGAWDNAPKAAVQCTDAACNGTEAAYYQVQIRSADEPMTSFYKVGFVCLCAAEGGVGGVVLQKANLLVVVYDLWNEMER